MSGQARSSSQHPECQQRSNVGLWVEQREEVEEQNLSFFCLCILSTFVRMHANLRSSRAREKQRERDFFFFPNPSGFFEAAPDAVFRCLPCQWMVCLIIGLSEMPPVPPQCSFFLFFPFCAEQKLIASSSNKPFMYIPYRNHLHSS